MLKLIYKPTLKQILLILFIFTLHSELLSQNKKGSSISFVDKCGYCNPILAKQQLAMLGDHWGYGYDSLLVDLDRWAQSPFVRIDSLGASVQNRPIWQLTITSDNQPNDSRQIVFIHARTHPGEVQGWWVTNEVITLLLSEDDFARFVRANCIFYIIPMYNPDGVELEFPRENANGIDIESNWDKNPVEAEVAVLRERFTELMFSGSPIEAALNMHSAVACQRFFVYHDAAGTSSTFTLLEQNFIGGVRSYFEEGIQPWYYFISWKNGTPPYYPESWFWNYFGEQVMALTYEDMNCTAAGDYHQTAFALLHGVLDYLGLVTTVAFGEYSGVESYTLRQNYPNPLRLTQNSQRSTIIQYELGTSQNIKLSLYDILGRQVKILDEGFRSANVHRVYFDATHLSNGTYFYRLETKQGTQIKRLTVMK